MFSCTFSISTYAFTVAESTGRGLVFQKTDQVEKKKKNGAKYMETVVVDEKFYHGDVGDLPHDKKYYVGIVKDIMGQIDDDGWPQEAQVSIISGGKQDTVPWKQVPTRNDLKDKF